MYTTIELESMVINSFPFISLAILNAKPDVKIKMKKRLFECVAPCIDEINELTENNMILTQNALMRMFRRRGWV